MVSCPLQSEADIAAEHGLTPVSFAIYELSEGHLEDVPATSIHEERASCGTTFDEDTKRVAGQVESVVVRHSGVVDWKYNEEVKRLMRRDVKREIRPTGDYTEDQLDELANQIVELAQHRSGQ